MKHFSSLLSGNVLPVAHPQSPSDHVDPPMPPSSSSSVGHHYHAHLPQRPFPGLHDTHVQPTDPKMNFLTEHTVKQVHDAFQELCEVNSRKLFAISGSAVLDTVGSDMPKTEHITCFHSRNVPALTLYELGVAMDKASRCGRDALMVALVIMARFCLHSHVPPTAHMMHRMYVACLHVGLKAHCDRYFRNDHFAYLAGVGTKELLAQEWEVLRGARWAVQIHGADIERMCWTVAAANNATARSPRPHGTAPTSSPLTLEVFACTPVRAPFGEQLADSMDVSSCAFLSPTSMQSAGHDTATTGSSSSAFLSKPPPPPRLPGRTRHEGASTSSPPPSPAQPVLCTQSLLEHNRLLQVQERKEAEMTHGSSWPSEGRSNDVPAGRQDQGRVAPPGGSRSPVSQAGSLQSQADSADLGAENDLMSGGEEEA